MRADATPEEVVDEAFRRLEAEEYDSAAELYHDDFVAYSVADAHRWARPMPSVPTVEGLLEHYPDMPREAAEYEVKQSKNRPRTPDFEELWGVESLDQLDALEPRTVLARRLEGTDDRPRFREYLDRLADENPQYADQLAEQKARLRFMWEGSRALGSIEQLDRAYVVVGISDDAVADFSAERPDDPLARIVVVKRSEEGWRVSSELCHGRGWASVLHVRVVDESGNTIVLS